MREVTAILDNPEALMEQGPFNRDEIDAQAAETYEHLGRVCLKGKRIEAAVVAFQKAMQKDRPRSARLSFNLAEVYVEQGQPGQALTQIEQYLRSQPQGMDGYELRIKVQRQLGRDADVVPSLEKSALADRNNVALQLLLRASIAGPADSSKPSRSTNVCSRNRRRRRCIAVCSDCIRKIGSGERSDC